VSNDIALRITLDLPYEQTVEKVIAGLKEEGFGVLTEIDVQATFRSKLGADFQKYVILGACNPPLAHLALSTTLDVGLLLPCNVVVYEQDGGSAVAILDPLAMLGVVESPELGPVAQEARTRLQRVTKALGASRRAGS
jgi:uncharacterized protein (DUF302 family)